MSLFAGFTKLSLGSAEVSKVGPIVDEGFYSFEDFEPVRPVDADVEIVEYQQYDKAMDTITVLGKKRPILEVAEKCYDEFKVRSIASDFSMYECVYGKYEIFISIGMGNGPTVEELKHSGMIRATYAALTLYGFDKIDELYKDLSEADVVPVEFEHQNQCSAAGNAYYAYVSNGHSQHFTTAFDGTKYTVHQYVDGDLIGIGVSSKERVAQYASRVQAFLNGMFNRDKVKKTFCDDCGFMVNMIDHDSRCSDQYGSFNPIADLVKTILELQKHRYKKKTPDSRRYSDFYVELNKIWDIKYIAKLYRTWLGSGQKIPITHLRFLKAYLHNKDFFNYVHLVLTKKSDNLLLDFQT